MVSIDSDVVEEGYEEVRKYHAKEDDHNWFEDTRVDDPRLYVEEDVHDALWYHSDRDWSEYVDKEADEDIVTMIADRIIDEYE